MHVVSSSTPVGFEPCERQAASVFAGNKAQIKMRHRLRYDLQFQHSVTIPAGCILWRGVARDE